MKGDSSDQRQSSRLGIPLKETNEGAGVEVAGGRMPLAALAPPAPALPLGTKPETLGGPLPGKVGYVVVGGTGLRNGSDQNRAPAAF